MGETKAQWNLLQLAFIAVYPAYLSYIRIVDGMSLVALYVFLFVLCIPAMFIQMKLGSYEQRGLVGILSRHLPIAKGVGVALLIDLFLTCVYVAPLVCHFGVYAVISMIEKPYVWSTCQTWSNGLCVEVATENLASEVKAMSAYTVQKPRSNEMEFFINGYLQLSSNVDNVTGFPNWQFTDQLETISISLLPVALTIVWVLVFLFTGFGARVAGWILFILGPAFLGTLFAVLGYGYANLDKNASNQFLLMFYNLNFKGFFKPTDTKSLITDWTHGFNLLMNSFPVWTAIPCTLGKFTGRGKISRNVGWLIMIVVYALVVQVPLLAMAPYLGNLMEKTKSESELKDENFNGGYRRDLLQTLHIGIKLVFTAMPRAFSELEIPPVYALLFYLSIFIAGLMFLCVAMLTIIHNIVDSMTSRFVRLHGRDACCTFVMTFIMMIILLGIGLLHTTTAGFYYTHLMDQAVTRLRFITVFILAVSVIIVYVKHKFNIAERILISIWCILAATAAAGFWLYSFIQTAGGPLVFDRAKFPQAWDLVGWIISGIPYIAIPAAAMHSCALYEGSCTEKSHYMLCGSEEESHNYDEYYPATEPSAPPAYSYDYNSSLYPMDDLHKNSYDPEMEPLDTRLRSSRI